MPSAPKLFRPLGAPAKRKGAKLEDRFRGSAAKRGYDRDWRKLREIKLKRDPLCEDCLADGRTEPAREVDHVERFRDADGRIDHRKRLDPKNLRSLCKPCHSRKTARETWHAQGVGG
ncbi:MAG: HNH endonuclease signature motif containing protein [Oceanicaulis sp.]